MADPNVTTLADLLKQAGYITGHFGKWHLGRGTGSPPLAEYGFDVTKAYRVNGPQIEDDYAHEYQEKHGGMKAGNSADSAELPYFRANSTRIIVDNALRFVEASKGKPFYVNVWTLLPHAPLNPTLEQLSVYKNIEPRADDPAFGDWMKKYLTNAGVDSTGILRARKRSLYEGGVRTTCLIRWPGKVPKGCVDEESVIAAVDLLPTLCAWAGIKVPDTAQPDGENVGDIALGKTRSRHKPILWEYLFKIWGDDYVSPMLAIRDGQWKLLLNPDKSRVELYNIPIDPEERANIASTYQDIVLRLSRLVFAWQKTLPPNPDRLVWRNPA